MREKVRAIFNELMQRLPELQINLTSIEAAFECLQQCYANGNKVLICGNGGSAADSEHIVGELMKGFILKRGLGGADQAKLQATFPREWQYLVNNLQGSLPAISLVSQSALTSDFINDVAPDMVFAQQVYGYGRSGDVLIGLSTSGNSKNVINAVKVAKAFGIHTIGMTGQNGGVMKSLCDITIMVPATETFKVQEYHLPVYHAICAMIEVEFFGILDIK